MADTKENKPVTIRDVAKDAEVSVASVSRYLNGYRLREENEIRIRSSIERLDYTENIIAKGMRKNRSMTIGVVINRVTDPFMTSITSVLEEKLEKYGYSIILCDYSADHSRLLFKLKFLLDRSIDGLILFPFETEKNYDVLHHYATHNVPVVLINDDIKGFESDRIHIQNYEASYNAVNYLIKMHHHEIGLITGKKEEFTSQERYRGSVRAFTDHGLQPDDRLIESGEYTTDGGYYAAKKILSSEKKPTALLSFSYAMTIGALSAVNELHISIPEELSLISFDDIPMFRIIKPSITVIKQPLEEIGELAAKTIVKRMRHDHTDFPVTHRLETQFILRDSVLYR